MHGLRGEDELRGSLYHKKAPSVAWPVSLGSKARRLCMRGEAESGDVGDMRLQVLACRENLPVGPRLSAGALPQCRNELK